MIDTASSQRPQPTSMLVRIAPGLQALAAYRRKWLKHDLIAGVSVAAVALPTAIAYAQIIGFDPVVGLYAAIPALLAYAVFGTSRHLIVNPDAATCAMIAAVLAPLAAGNPQVLLSLSVVLAIFTGLLCLFASWLRLGFLADFLSRPILIGFLNGVAINIFLGQIGKLFGFPMKAHGIIPSFIEFMHKLPETRLPTLAVGLLTIAVLLASKRFLPRWPGPLLAVAAGIAVVQFAGLESKGVAIVGDVPAGLPRLRWPTCDPQLLQPLFGGAGRGAGELLQCDGRRPKFRRQERLRDRCRPRARGLGRQSGGRRPVPGLCRQRHGVADGHEPRHGRQEPARGTGRGRGDDDGFALPHRAAAYLPQAALGEVLIFAAIGLFDVAELRRLWHVSRAELALAVVTTLAVIALDILEGILVAVALAILLLLQRSARPPDAVLVRVPGIKGFHSLIHHPDAPATPGLLLYRFGAAIVFYNVFVLEEAGAGPGGFAERPETHRYRRQHRERDRQFGGRNARSLAHELRQRGVRLALAGFRTETREFLQRTARCRPSATIASFQHSNRQ